MDIEKLPIGVQAPEDSDCISIQELDDGRFRLNGSALLRCGDTEEAESVALIGGEPYPSFDEAEAAGLAWAAEHCVGTLYVSSGTPTQPVQ